LIDFDLTKFKPAARAADLLANLAEHLVGSAFERESPPLVVRLVSSGKVCFEREFDADFLFSPSPKKSKVKGTLNPNFFNLTINTEKNLL